MQATKQFAEHIHVMQGSKLFHNELQNPTCSFLHHQAMFGIHILDKPAMPSGCHQEAALFHNQTLNMKIYVVQTKEMLMSVRLGDTQSDRPLW
jgi:hypothetical protein